MGSTICDVLSHTNHIFSESSWSKDIKTDITKCLILKYTHTNTQIQHITMCQKDPACGIFLKRRLFRSIKNDIHMCQTHKFKITNTQIQIHKYKNTQIQRMTKCQIHPTCGIFLKRGLFRGIKNDMQMCQTHTYKN